MADSGPHRPGDKAENEDDEDRLEQTRRDLRNQELIAELDQKAEALAKETLQERERAKAWLHESHLQGIELLGADYNLPRHQTESVRRHTERYYALEIDEETLYSIACIIQKVVDKCGGELTIQVIQPTGEDSEEVERGHHPDFIRGPQMPRFLQSVRGHWEIIRPFPRVAPERERASCCRLPCRRFGARLVWT